MMNKKRKTIAHGEKVENDHFRSYSYRKVSLFGDGAKFLL